nr:MFS transporter [Pseudopithomyces chartarum]
MPLVAFLATFGMNAAAASSVFVFARILCKDSSSCNGDEQNAFARSLAIATVIANVCAILVIQPLHAVSKKTPNTVLMLWLVCRSTSIALLWLAASFKSMSIVLLSKVLEGTATDNILQFALSTIYARAKDQKQFSTLMSESMAFSLLGSSLGPLTAGLGRDFSSRILIAICALVLAALYVGYLTIVGRSHAPNKNNSQSLRDQISVTTEGHAREGATLLRDLFQGMFSHFSIFAEKPRFLSPSLSLLLYTNGQAYILPALMVYASGRYGFTDRQSSWLLSLVTAVSATSTFFVRLVQQRIKGDIAHLRLNMMVAVMQMSALAISLPLIMETNYSWQLYLVTTAMSLGFSASGFIKTYALCQLQHPNDGTAALAIFETVGSLLSPLTLGAAQSHWHGGSWTFLSTGMMIASIAVLLVTMTRRVFIPAS